MHTKKLLLRLLPLLLLLLIVSVMQRGCGRDYGFFFFSAEQISRAQRLHASEYDSQWWGAFAVSRLCALQVGYKDAQSGGS